MNLPLPDIRDLELRYHSAAATASKLTVRQSKLAIINTANRPWSVIDSKVFFEEWTDIETVEFYYSPKGRPFDDTGLAIDKKMSVVSLETDLLNAIHTVDPSVIYLRVSPHTLSEYLVALIRIQFPTVCLLIEFYDTSCLFNEEALSYIFEGSQHQKLLAEEGNATAFHYADGIILKMGGRDFEEWAADIKVPVITFFPSIGDMEAPYHDTIRKTRKALYAGSLSARELIHGIGSVDGANIIKYFDAFLDMNDCTLDIVNGAHTLIVEDNSLKFAGLIKRYADNTQITYYRSMPRQKLVAMALKYDIGICCAHYADDCVMDVTRFGLPNRMMTYIEAGLPVVIDDRFDYASELIHVFNAGAVIAAGDFVSFKKIIGGLDLVQARDGVVRLKEYMVKENAKSLVKLRRLADSESVFPKIAIE